MSPELDKLLVQKYPKLYKDRHGDMRKTLMCWGFDCDDGWFKIIDDLSNKLEAYGGVTAVQVKEKFGGLRFYVTTEGLNDDQWHYVHRLIEEASKLSYKTCEVCGDAGKPNKEGWIKTLCKKHFESNT